MSLTMANNVPTQVDDDIPVDELEDRIEKAVGELFAAMYKLRESKQYQREYDTKGFILNMLTEDRQFLRENYGVKL